MAIIVLDPGHGGTTATGDSSANNATGPKGTLEKDLTLKVALLARAALTDLGHTVLLTRSTDVNVGLIDRAAVSKDNQAALFVSIHFNAPPNGVAYAQGTLTLLSMHPSIISASLARLIQAAVRQATGLNDQGVRNQQLGVLNPAHHLSTTAMCLSEMSFLSGDAEEEARLNTEAYQLKLAVALTKGVTDYLTQSAPGVSTTIDEPWFDVLKTFWDITRMVQYYPPVRFAPGITVSPFGPYNAGTAQTADWHFRTSIRFVASNAPAPPLFAMGDGCIFFQPGAAADLGTLVLHRGDSLGTSVSQATGMLPPFYPQPKYIVYENVSRASARSAAVTTLKRATQKAVALEDFKKKGPPTTSGAKEPTSEQLADLWLAGSLPSGIFVLGGDLIGAQGAAISGRSSVEVSMVETIDPAPDLYYNPAYFLACWNDLRMLKDAQVFPELVSVSGPPSGNGVIHLVSGGGASALGQKLSQASSGDTILITDHEIYSEALVIDKGVNIVSTSAQVVDPASVVGDPKTPIDAFADYPTLSGNSSFRPVVFEPPATGIAHLGKVAVKKGSVAGFAPKSGTGGGILINRANHVVLSNCFVEECVTTDSAQIRTGNGGGIDIYSASPAIFACVVHNNTAAGRGGGIASYGYGWPAIYACRVENNVTTSTDGDGGGVSIQVAVPDLGKPLWDPVKLASAFGNYVRIIGCTVGANKAGDDGGGVYITNASRVIIRDCRVTDNTAINNGGGIRVTFGAYLLLTDCLVSGNTSNSANSIKTVAGGGGVAARNAGLIQMIRVSILNNTANNWAGGGLSFISADEGTQTFLGIGIIDWNAILGDKAVYAHERARLMVDAASRISANRAVEAITLEHPNAQHAKGGGAYLLRNAASDGKPWWDLFFIFFDSRQSILTTNSADALWDPADTSSSRTNRVYFLDVALAALPDGRADDTILAAREASGNQVFLNAL